MTMETRSRYWGRIPYVTGSSQVIFVFIGGTHVGQSRAGGCFRGIGANAAQVQVQCASHGCSRGLHRCAATADWRSVAHSPARNGRKACAQLSLRAPRVVVELEDTHTSPLASRVTRAFVHWTSTQSTHQCSLFWLVVSAQLRKPRNFSRKELVCECEIFICSARKLVKCYCWRIDRNARSLLCDLETSWGTDC